MSRTSLSLSLETMSLDLWTASMGAGLNGELSRLKVLASVSVFFCCCYLAIAAGCITVPRLALGGGVLRGLSVVGGASLKPILDYIVVLGSLLGG